MGRWPLWCWRVWALWPSMWSTFSPWLARRAASLWRALRPPVSVFPPHSSPFLLFFVPLTTKLQKCSVSMLNVLFTRHWSFLWATDERGTLREISIIVVWESILLLQLLQLVYFCFCCKTAPTLCLCKIYLASDLRQETASHKQCPKMQCCELMPACSEVRGNQHEL